VLFIIITINIAAIDRYILEERKTIMKKIKVWSGWSDDKNRRAKASR